MRPRAINAENAVEKRYLREMLCKAADSRCAYCNAPTKLREGTIDHHMPQALGGLTIMSNLRWSCVTCNGLKADMTPDEWARKQPAKAPDAVSARTKLLQAIASRARGHASLRASR